MSNVDIIIEPGNKEKVDEIQAVYNHPAIIGHLGGMTFRDSILSKLKSSGITLWVAKEGENTVGSMMIAGRSQCHFAKFGEVGVLPDYRRKRIGTALYAAIIAQGIIEGRRLWEDTIVGNNPYQFEVLPTIGLEKLGILRKRTASFLDIHLFGYCLSIEKLKETLNRVPSNFKIIIQEDFYSTDLWNKNMDIYNKKNYEFIHVINEAKSIILNDPRFEVRKGPDKHPNQMKKKENDASGNIKGDEK